MEICIMPGGNDEWHKAEMESKKAVKALSLAICVSRRYQAGENDAIMMDIRTILLRSCLVLSDVDVDSCISVTLTPKGSHVV